MYSCKNWEHFVKLEDQQLLDLCQQTFYKGSGRGGQNRNKLSNGIQLDFYHLSSRFDKYRYLHINKLNALKDLRLKIALDFFPNYQLRPQSAINVWVGSHDSYRLSLVNKKNNNFALVCGFLIDDFIKLQGDWKKLAKHLGVSNSQLSAWFKKNYMIKERLLYLSQLFI